MLSHPAGGKFLGGKKHQLMHEKAVRLSLVSLLTMLICMDIVAQDWVSRRGVHGGEFGIAMIDHAYVGDEVTGGHYGYQGIGFGLSYTGSQIRTKVIFAHPEEGRTFFDVSALGWLSPSFSRIKRENTAVSMPIGVLVAWRRVTGGKNASPLGVHAILFGAGGELNHSMSDRTSVGLRVIPLAGITGTQIADAVGLSWTLDAEVRLFVAEFFSSLGLTIGYAFRYQFWNVNGSRAFSDGIDEVYDYAGTVHTFSAGGRF